MAVPQAARVWSASCVSLPKGFRMLSTPTSLIPPSISATVTREAASFQTGWSQASTCAVIDGAVPGFSPIAVPGG